MDSLRNQPGGDDTTETVCAQLAAVYRYILNCHAKKKAARPSKLEDPTDDKGRITRRDG